MSAREGIIASGMRRRSSVVPPEQQTLLEHVLPSPEKPGATRRALSVVVVGAFLLLAAFMAATSDTLQDVARGISQSRPAPWIYGKPDYSVSTTKAVEEAGMHTAQDGIDGEDTLDDLHQAGKAHFAKYLWHRDLNWDADGSGRLIVVGDVHGMVKSLKEMLHALEISDKQTSTHNDTLVFVGDLVAKHPSIKASLQTVDYIRSLRNAHAVRGNHDQDVINWRNWMDSPSASLGLTNAQTLNDHTDTPPTDIPEALKHKWRDEHFHIAQALSVESAKWMQQRSLTLHIRTLHTYIVHAGLLPWTIPKRTGGKKGEKKIKGTDAIKRKDNPNAKAPATVMATDASDELVDGSDTGDDDDISDDLNSIDFTNQFNLSNSASLEQSAASDRFVPVHVGSHDSNMTVSKNLDPEMAILLNVPLNRDPFTLLEMRSLLKDGSVSKGTKKGSPWAPIWNRVMAGCQILNGQEIAANKNKHTKCRPLSVMWAIFSMPSETVSADNVI